MTTYPVTLNRSSNLTTQHTDAGFQKFIQHAYQAPILSAEEEYQLAIDYKQHNNLEAAHKLVHSYLRLVLKIAKEYSNYQLNLPDLVQEGTVGLMHAVKKFNPDNGNRLAAYASWWIRAAIHEFILNSWRMVKIATTQLKRKLFFKLRQAKESALPLEWQEAEELAKKFGTDAATIIEMDGRMLGADTSLNQTIMEEEGEILDLIPDHRPNQEHAFITDEKVHLQHTLIQKGLSQLNLREQLIISKRFLTNKQTTLETLSSTLNISRERVRQIEKRALEKLKIFFQSLPEGREVALGLFA